MAIQDTNTQFVKDCATKNVNLCMSDELWGSFNRSNNNQSVTDTAARDACMARWLLSDATRPAHD